MIQMDQWISETTRVHHAITLLGGAAAARPLVARAQQAKSPIIGYLNAGNPPVDLTTVFRQGLKDSGYVEGQNLTIEYRYAEGQYDRLGGASGRTRRGVAVIAASPTPAALAAKAATTKIPIVFRVGGDPIQEGLVDSLNRPRR